MTEKVSFQEILTYGGEIILANVSLMIFSSMIGGVATLGFGELIPQTGILGAATGFIFFSGATYSLMMPALIYKIIADGVAKGKQLEN